MTGKATILIIDDSRPPLTHLEKILKPLDCNILTAGNGVEGVKLYRSNPDGIKLVITDIVMPEKEGLETIKELLTMNPNLKIIAMTSGNLNYLNWAEVLGAVKTLTKPFPSNTLETVRNILLS